MPMKYEAATIKGTKVILGQRSMDNAWDDYTWEKDPELASLDAAPVVDISFDEYSRDYAEDVNTFYPTSRRFAINTLDGKHIGNCSYYNISEAKGEAELGILIGNRNFWNKGYGTDVVNTLVDYVFNETKLNRIYLKTLVLNYRAQKCFQKCGFTSFRHLNRDGYSFLLMELSRKQWWERQSKSPLQDNKEIPGRVS